MKENEYKPECGPVIDMDCPDWLPQWLHEKFTRDCPGIKDFHLLAVKSGEAYESGDEEVRQSIEKYLYAVESRYRMQRRRHEL